ncbi:MAG: Hsp20/alpha crystallin family protein [Euryarchaeota archaeon]|nr:Hsp20/alpha crystallin family protein [Euryarchaeota archaeon]
MWRDPFEELRNLERRMNRLFEELLQERPALAPGVREPFADIMDTGKEIKVTVELPGVSKEDIKINATERELEVIAEVKREEEEKKGDYVRRERSYRMFRRSFALPAEVDPSRARATYRNGVLEVTLPKVREEKTSIKVE